MCVKGHCDDEHQIIRNKHLWCLQVLSCPDHNSMCVTVFSRGTCLCHMVIGEFQPNGNLLMCIIMLVFLLESIRLLTLMCIFMLVFVLESIGLLTLMCILFCICVRQHQTFNIKVYFVIPVFMYKTYKH